VAGTEVEIECERVTQIGRFTDMKADRGGRQQDGQLENRVRARKAQSFRDCRQHDAEESNQDQGLADGTGLPVFPGRHRQSRRSGEEQLVQHGRAVAPELAVADTAHEPRNGEHRKHRRQSEERTQHQRGELPGDDVQPRQVRQEQESEGSVAAFLADSIGSQEDSGQHGEEVSADDQGIEQELPAAGTRSCDAHEQQHHERQERREDRRTRAHPERRLPSGSGEELALGDRQKRHVPVH
jgi:hypothetical protein